MSIGFSNAEVTDDFFLFFYFLDGNCTPAVEARSLNHWTAREVPLLMTFMRAVTVEWCRENLNGVGSREEEKTKKNYVIEEIAP